MPISADAPILNRSRLQEVCMGDEEFLGELIDLFLADAEPQMEALSAAVGERDAERTLRVAHRLKGACRNIGADRLAEPCAELERLAPGDPASESVEALCRTIGERMKSTVQALVEVRRQGPRAEPQG